MNTAVKADVILAKIRVPVHRVDVEQHGSAGVGHVSAVDSARLAAGQTLLDSFHNSRQLHRCRKSPISTEEVGILSDYPNEPGVHGAEHGAVRNDSLVDLVYVVHQPAELHRAEVSADGEPCFMLQSHETQSVISFTQNLLMQVCF